MKESTGKFYQEAVNRALEFVEANLGKPIYLEEVSSKAHISRFHFHRIFKAMTGSTLNDYIIRLRLEKGAKLLLNSELSINDISANCGFLNHESFTRSFSSYFGKPPTEFRSQHEKIPAERSGTNNPVSKMQGLSGP